VVIKLDDPNLWIQTCELWVFFVSMCYAHGHGEFSNFPTLRYVALCHNSGGGYQLQVCIFKLGDYVYLYNKQHQLLWMWL
jgi:hypothetical protein